MKKQIYGYMKSLLVITSVVASLSSCKYKDLVAYPYSESIYLPATAFAAFGSGGNGLYTITPAVQGQSSRYIVDKTNGKFMIPLSVMRSAVNASASQGVNIFTNNDTVTKVIAGGKFNVPADPLVTTDLLPATAFSLPTDIVVKADSSQSNFNLAIDLNFVINSAIATPKKKYAIGVGIASLNKTLLDPVKSFVIIFLDPAAVVLPTANFTTYTDNVYKTVGFVNVSLNGTTYSWDYGDGTPVFAGTESTHKYAAAGTYSVKLTTTGISGLTSVKTASVTIL